MVNFDDRSPIYLQIADQIRAAILSGELEEGDQVMSTTQYATTYRINPATAAKAMNELVAENLIYKRRGLGMFVADGAQQTLINRLRETFFADELQPVLDNAALLGITSAELITYIQGEQK